jgi:hypothetical protein
MVNYRPRIANIRARKREIVASAGIDLSVRTPKVLDLFVISQSLPSIGRSSIDPGEVLFGNDKSVRQFMLDRLAMLLFCIVTDPPGFEIAQTSFQTPTTFRAMAGGLGTS